MAATTKTKQGRSRALTYQELLDTDTRPVPEVLRAVNPLDLPYQEIAIDRYLSRDFFSLEIDKLWKRVWQMACREDDISAVGDHLVYEIAGLSFIVVRTAADQIRAFYNSCLHRGRLLREAGGQRAAEFRCPFHGFAWNLDGTLKHVPCQWDFPQLVPARPGTTPPPAQRSND